MIVQKIFPEVIAELSTLREQLVRLAKNKQVPDELMGEVIASIPEPIINSGSFRDKMTGIWRYEFGIPYDINGDLVWGTHMWPPVENLFDAVVCVKSKLSQKEQLTYMERLANPSKHQSVLVEVIPVLKIDKDVPVQYEVAGLGIGNSTVDWVIGPHQNRSLLIDIKKRDIDFIKQMENTQDKEVNIPPPEHNPELLFRGSDKKFNVNDPDACLQGLWIVTDIKQEEKTFVDYFMSLNPDKFHYVVLGDWERDAYILTRRDQDKVFLADLFRVNLSERFVFSS